ncbi:MAG TPA: hypothetical protein VHY91_09165 [Pirellulales bacterium]|jgi:hypothetical protein|nr:hypothetical protein [Pirellulales bacterium]HEX4143689.1 hypothetical protein [Pirellulales bacterium]
MTMISKFSFPFWIVTQRHGSISRPIESKGMPGFIVAFTAAENAASFMVGRGDTEWENKLVARSTLPSLLKDLRRIGIQGVCIDPINDGCGNTIVFEELERYLL